MATRVCKGQPIEPPTASRRARDRDVHHHDGSTRSLSVRDLDVVVVGAGIGGLTTAIALQRTAG